MNKQLKTANATEISEAASLVAQRHVELGTCDPNGAWHNWRSINNLWNPWSPETQEVCERERPLAYQVFVKAYLTTQGWKR